MTRVSGICYISRLDEGIQRIWGSSLDFGADSACSPCSFIRIFVLKREFSARLDTLGPLPVCASISVTCSRPLFRGSEFSVTSRSPLGFLLQLGLTRSRWFISVQWWPNPLRLRKLTYPTFDRGGEIRARRDVGKWQGHKEMAERKQRSTPWISIFNSNNWLEKESSWSIVSFFHCL